MEESRKTAQRKQRKLQEEIKHSYHEDESALDCLEEENDDLEDYFMEKLNEDLSASTKFEEKKKKEEADADYPEDDEVDFENKGKSSIDDLEARLIDDIQACRDQESNQDDNKPKQNSNQCEYEKNYEIMISKFSNIIKERKRKQAPLEDINEISMNVWSLVDEWEL